MLPQAEGVDGASPDCRVVGRDDAFRPRHHAESRHEGTAHRELRAVAGEGGELEEGGTCVEEEFDPFSSAQLASGRVARLVLLAPSGDCGSDFVSEISEVCVLSGGVGGEGRTRWIDVRGENAHRSP